MSERTWNEKETDDVKAAVIMAITSAPAFGDEGWVTDIAKDVVSRLTAPTLRPDRPVMYDTGVLRHAVSYMFSAPPNAINVRAMFAEDEVMGVIDKWIRSYASCGIMEYCQSQLDAIKYGDAE